MPPGGNYTDLVNLAVLHYSGAANANPMVDPTTNIPASSSPLVETNLHVRGPKFGMFPGRETENASSPSRPLVWYVMLKYMSLSGLLNRTVQPGDATPGGADININLTLGFVSQGLSSNRMLAYYR